MAPRVPRARCPEMAAERPRTAADVEVFERHRSDLTALAYRMLGDVARARDMVQEAWLRWQGRELEVRDPRAFLVTVVTRLCLNELGSARVRLERSRPDRLPEPVDLGAVGLDRLERREQISMAFLVLLERLTPAERAVLLLHDVFEFSHDEIATAIARSPIGGRSAAASRKLLERARRKLAEGRRLLSATPEEHERLFEGFLHAAQRGDIVALLEVLAEDAVLITDGGAAGRRFGRFRNLRRPLQGARSVAAFIAATAHGAPFDFERRALNGQPGLALHVDGEPFAALLLAIAGGKVHQVYFHADRSRLENVGRVGAGQGGSTGPR
jgi:RNA polymerase sigma-70 factor, ECF subfamily